MKWTPTRENISKGLKEARKHYNKNKPKELQITQEDLAEKMGVSLKTIMNWEQGQAIPSLEKLSEMADLYHCDLDYLTGRMKLKTHDLQFIHDQTGLSEKAIEKLQRLIPDWDQMERDLRESAPEISEVKINDHIQRQRRDWETSIARDFPDIISLLIEDVDSEYLLSLITRRVKGYDPRSRSDMSHKDLIKDDMWLDLDGQKVLTHKKNMLDSLIQSEVSTMIHAVSETYHTKSEQ